MGGEPSPLPTSAQRVAELLRAHGHPGDVVMLEDSARTAQEAADALGCTVAEIAKSVVFRHLVDEHAVVVVTSGDNRVDTHKVARYVGPVGKADAEFVRYATGYAIGGVAPIGHQKGTVVLVDRDLERFEHIWAAAGHPHAVFRLTPAELVVWTGSPGRDVRLE
jgi:prolyl-tRNA editing enzyme YbaK/EbsC (Cys-tRNA(Pro) deacylase)